MKTKIKTGTISMILIGIILLIATNCQKEEESSAIKDKDGNIYTSVTIGTQVWMVENLKTTKYNDGSPIPLVTDKNAWLALRAPGYCWYDNDAATYKDPYGAYYNWWCVNTGKLCPSGWHVPSVAEWNSLVTSIGGESEGYKLKETGTTHWESPNNRANNVTGFTAIPAGERDVTGNYVAIDNWCLWWSSTEASSLDAWDFAILNNDFVYSDEFNKRVAVPIRCVKD